jgi:EAL domain-containing protein (putative c-di-GMP-specific phosphodiesterase class I)
VGAISRAEKLEHGLALRTAADRAAWADPSGIRGVIRHSMSSQAAVVLLGAAVVAGLFSERERWVFLGLAAAASAQLLARPIAERLGRTYSPELDFRIALAGWPPALVALGWAGWATPDDLGEIVAVAGFVVAALVALAESTPVAIIWTAVSAAAVTLGAALDHDAGLGVAIVAGAICGGTLTGARLRMSLEGFLGARSRLMRDVVRVPVSEDPFVTAELLLVPLVRWTPLKNPSIIWFTRDDRSVFLAVAGSDLPPQLQAGRELPAERNVALRQQADNGPWISGWTVRSDDGGYSRGVASLGINAVAYVPMVFEGRVIGLVGAGLSDRGDDRSSMAEYVPTLVGFADAAAVELGPALMAREQTSTARVLVDDILANEAFWPVFQPVRRLSDGHIVGYEALTRFEVSNGPVDVFGKARLAGRLRELEVATIRAAAAVSERLPADCWISINCSPDLLGDVGVLADLLEPIRQDVVIELSEHEAVADYAPIAAGMARLGPRRRLAVDDAGAGFASLRHILEVRPHLVKLDIGLVQDVANDLTRTALIAGFARFANDAGFELVAEGIELEADRKALHRLGVTFGQGYLLGTPERHETVARSRAEPSGGSEPERRVRSRRDNRTAQDTATTAARAG